MMIIMIGMVAFALDLGFMTNDKTELRRTADAAALAGAGALVNGTSPAGSAVYEYVNLNQTGGRAIPSNNVGIQYGSWNRTTKLFTAGGSQPSAVEVTLSAQRPYFFGRVFGKTNFTTTTKAVATYQPREIMLVLDYSGSMSDDSELMSIGALGQSYIESNLATMYGELGSPTYGTLAFTPAYANLKGVAPTATNMPQIYVEWQVTKAKITSTKKVKTVVLQFTDNVKQTFTMDTKNIAVQGSGSNTGKELKYVWVKAGANDPDGDGYGEKFEDTDSNVLKAFGLNTVTYPYPDGSWSEYVEYVKESSVIEDAGYYKKYGYLTWINYLQEKHDSYEDTPDLWKTSEQPVTAVKDAVQMFFSYMQEVDTADRIGFTIYTSSDSKAKVESSLTYNYTTVETLVRQRQAGHYQPYTNIGDGIKIGLADLLANARTNAKKLIVLMTDGQANLPNSGGGPDAYCITQAYAAAAAKVPIICISLGSGADTSIMQQIADITGGVHFNIQGGQTADQYEEALKGVFRQVADDRPLQLVQ